MMSDEVIRQQKEQSREMGVYWMLGVSTVVFGATAYYGDFLLWPAVMLATAVYCFIQHRRKKK